MKNGIIWICVALLSMVNDSVAQKKVIDREAYGKWNHMDSPVISTTGKWITYWIRSVVNNPEDSAYYPPYVCVYNTSDGKSFRPDNAEAATISRDEKWLFYKTAFNPSDTVGRDSCVFVNLESGEKRYWERDYPCGLVLGGNYIFYDKLLYRKQNNTARLCVFLDIERRDSSRLDSVNRITYFGDNESLLYSKWDSDSVCSLWYGRIKGQFKRLDNKVAGVYAGHLLSGDERSLFLYMGSTAQKIKQPDLLYHMDLASGKSRLILDWRQVVIPDGYKFPSATTVAGKQMKYIYAELSPEAKGLPHKERRPGNFDFELWGWNDETIPSMQGVMPDSYSPKYVYNIRSRKWLCLSDSPLKIIDKPSNFDSDYVLKLDYTPYYRNANWTERICFDLYLVSLQDGSEFPVSKGLLDKPSWSPNREYVVFYHQDTKKWHVLKCRTGECRVASDDIPYPVHQEDYDYPQAPPAYGYMAWTEDGSGVIVRDKYDLWKIDLSGREKSRCITNGYGRKLRKELRIVLWSENTLKYEFRANVSDLKNDLLLKAVDEQTRAEGFYILKPGENPVKLIEGDYTYHFHHFSPDGKKCIWRRMNYFGYPDLWVSGSDFSNPRQVTEVNSQQKDYNWGKVELTSWNTAEGKTNRGLLYLPEDYDSAKTYPVIVQFYENSSNKIHDYKMPECSNSIIDIPTFVSRGYVVFCPDIQYSAIGHPGEDCYDVVIGGVNMLIEKGIADRQRIGVQGHSWAGFQVAYLVAHTNLFRCAQIGAGVVNAVSAYTGLRGNGSPRMFMYELTQSRLGKTLWEGIDLYLESSPILKADRITTPLLILHNNRDEAVPYSQGLDLFFAMRRLQKPAWLINYKNEGHILRNPDAMGDWTVRMQQFFDYYLKDAPKPRWMQEGITVQEAKTDLKYDFVH